MTEVALAAIRGGQPMSKLGQQVDVHPNQLKQRKDRLLAGASGAVDAEEGKNTPEVDLTTLHAQIGELTQ